MSICHEAAAIDAVLAIASNKSALSGPMAPSAPSRVRKRNCGLTTLILTGESNSAVRRQLGGPALGKKSCWPSIL